MSRIYRCDLHIHTCLSPCAELSLYPSALVRQARAEGIDIIAICDHNASENCHHVMQAAEKAGGVPAVLPGMEITSREEVHLIALFAGLEPLQRLQETVYAHLAGENDEERFGCQAIVNAADEVEGFNPRLLIGATDLSLEELLSGIHTLGGIGIASHIDREAFGVISQLGFVDPTMPFDALEVTRWTGLAGARQRYPELSRYPFVVSSDAHRLAEIGQGVTEMLLEAPAFEELKQALAHQGGRCLVGR